ncbi:KPN_02809 family neutral zinc metallopeptidase [Agrobacterium vitis]|uniref:Flagellar biosynthesis protein FlgM n=1 Tax=Agrobacterium vitis TaxID=373 RepID=A0A368NJB9_AGRVI|nr:neutral zinc metallopeptidase [Agrobacterium vitis]KAA3511911.1 flagellar biosynthesis protein FlgM [Agrobacterium vitis]KAA3525356.1 flagellar biosynthesis protein FlgM [Agrobacterium vitis]MCF1454435.1 flagellar biosynthesis protein FlgM [Agrobacterium vitis]MCF1479178.1 flagellar biosynthesis protein FlgM [Agrobacterium vitis]MUZ74240.1 flagellar biosynthesis protein FlgM [Agrobacterium vitis]
MELDGRRQSENVEDVRGASGGGGFGRRGIRLPIGGGGRGLSFSTIIILVLIYFGLRLMGIDMLQLLEEGSGSAPSSSQQQVSDTPEQADMKVFVSRVLASTEDVWTGVFRDNGQTYEMPKLRLFSGQYPSACGAASAATGPFYCPGDQRVYLDTAFFSELSRRFQASGDFAQAYVIAHEVGHHVQNLTGILPKFNQMRSSMSAADANRMSVRVELQADCFAGIWGRKADQQGLLSAGDLQEALNAARQIGDDTIQKRSQGYVVPESFNHGTAAQRMAWFKKGYDQGRMDACDTFSGPI